MYAAPVHENVILKFGVSARFAAGTAGMLPRQ